MRGRLFFGVIAGALLAPAPVCGEPIRMLTEWHGYFSSCRESTDAVLRTPSEWNEFWHTIYEYDERVHDPRTKPPPAPLVDFHRFMIIAVCLGERPTTGYDIRIGQVTRTPQQLLVQVQMSEPPESGVTGQALTQPFHAVLVERSPLPVEFVRVRGPSRVETPRHRGNQF